MAGQKNYEMKQLEAYRIADADGFCQHPDTYWAQAEKVRTPKKRVQKKAVKAAKDVKDNLTVIEGIGPKIAALLHDSGIETHADLAKAKVGTLSKILKEAGPRFAIHKPNSWPKQAKLARDKKIDALKKMQEKLKGGK